MGLTTLPPLCDNVVTTIERRTLYGALYQYGSLYSYPNTALLSSPFGLHGISAGTVPNTNGF